MEKLVSAQSPSAWVPWKQQAARWAFQPYSWLYAGQKGLSILRLHSGHERSFLPRFLRRLLARPPLRSLLSNTVLPGMLLVRCRDPTGRASHLDWPPQTSYLSWAQSGSAPALDWGPAYIGMVWCCPSWNWGQPGLRGSGPRSAKGRLCRSQVGAGAGVCCNVGASGTLGSTGLNGPNPADWGGRLGGTVSLWGQSSPHAPGPGSGGAALSSSRVPAIMPPLPACSCPPRSHPSAQADPQA